MTNNSTQPNTLESECHFNRDIVFDCWSYAFIVCSVASFVGNVLIILTVYKIKTLRTTTNLFIVNMAVSDVLVPTLDAIRVALLIRKDSNVLTQALGVALCKAIIFVFSTFYGVSMCSLVVITVYRFYAVAFPMRARLTRVRTCNLLLLCTWLLPIAVCCPLLYYITYTPERNECSFDMSKLFSWIITYLVFVVALPFLFMLVLYPVIVVKLVRQKVPGNSVSQSRVIIRRKRNIRLTKMFITVIVALLLTYGTYQVLYIIAILSPISDRCVFLKTLYFLYPLRDVFHAINPVIYFIFCSSYRQGIKQIFSSCCRQSTVRHNLPGGEQIELGNVPQE